MRKIWIIRQGESVANAGAATDDHRTIPLSQTGLNQSQNISLTIPHEPGLIITSPFTRARATAKPTIKGSLLRWSRHGRTAANSRYRGPDTCTGTESFRHLINRATAVIDRLLALPDRFILMFSHAQFICAMRLVRDQGDHDILTLMKGFRDLPRVEKCGITRWE